MYITAETPPNIGQIELLELAMCWNAGCTFATLFANPDRDPLQLNNKSKPPGVFVTL